MQYPYLILLALIFGTRVLHILRDFSAIFLGLGFRHFSDPKRFVALRCLMAAYVRLYDIFSYRTVLYHLVLLALIVTGLRYPFLFSFVLLDVLLLSEALGDVVNAVIIPGKQLALTAWLFLIVMLVFGAFAIEFFEGHFAVNCGTRVECFIWILYYGLQGGSIWEAMDDVQSSSNAQHYVYRRVAFDLTFYVVLGVLLFNLVTGVMIDTFGNLRDERAKRDDILENECFMCGLGRTQYEQMGPEYSFAKHKSEDHGMWNYIHFIVYLHKRDETDFTGGESE